MINTRSLTESLERKYNLNESFVEEECIVRSTDESLNEAHLNENPLLATAARAAIPAAIDVASNAISSAIDAKNESLSDEDIYDNLAGKLFNAAERFFMYSSDKITYDEWIRACEKAFFALEDEGHTCDYSNSINEDITEDMEYAVGDNETGYTYKSYEQALKAVKQQIEMAASVDGCEMITIQVVPTDGAGNEL